MRGTFWLQEYMHEYRLPPAIIAATLQRWGVATTHTLTHTLTQTIDSLATWLGVAAARVKVKSRSIKAIKLGSTLH